MACLVQSLSPVMESEMQSVCGGSRDAVGLRPLILIPQIRVSHQSTLSVDTCWMLAQQHSQLSPTQEAHAQENPICTHSPGSEAPSRGVQTTCVSTLQVLLHKTGRQDIAGPTLNNSSSPFSSIPVAGGMKVNPPSSHTNYFAFVRHKPLFKSEG